MSLFLKISNYSKSLNSDEILVIGIFLSIFMPLVLSNFLLGMSLIFLFFNFKKNILKKKINLLLPILFFLWILFSYLWSINPEKTLHSIPRQLFFLIFPLFFLLRSHNFEKIKNKVFEIFTFSAVIFSLVFLARAIVRFFITKNTAVFFFHGSYNDDFGLVPKELNAVHVSVFTAIAFLILLIKENKSKRDVLTTCILLFFLLLLGSTNIIITTFLLCCIYYFFISKSANRLRLRNLLLLIGIVSVIFFYNKIERFVELEFRHNTQKGIGHNVINETEDFSKKVTLYEAWNNDGFTPNDFFPGMAFRVYQTRLFFELLNENQVFWNGFGYNASQSKLEEKGKKYNVFLGNEDVEGYQKKNFHNQYLQVFAELGLVGFIILILMLVMSLRKAIQNKDFLHISFTILMISLFLTESFLWRQRGVVFFTAFYCLFMMQPKLNKN